MLLVDTVKGELVDDEHLKAEYASRQPYGEWLDRNLVNLSDLTVPNRKIPSYTREEMVRLQKAFGYRYEDLKTIMLPMGEKRRGTLRRDGSDTPLGRSQPHPPAAVRVFQADVCAGYEPAIDALRERIRHLYHRVRGRSG